MNETLLFSVLAVLKLTIYSFTLLFAVGIVWRVEKELDVSFKWIALAVFCLFVAEIVEMVPALSEAGFWTAALQWFRLAAALFLFFGMYFMRDLVRKIDGEKKL